MNPLAFLPPSTSSMLPVLLVILAAALWLATLSAGLMLLSNLALRREIERWRRLHAVLAERQAQLQTTADGRRRFIAYLSHESRNLVAGIFGSLRAAELHRHDPALRPLADALHCNAQALLDLLDASLDAAQIDAGRFSTRPMPIDVVGALAGVAAEPQFSSRGERHRAPTVHACITPGSLWLVDGVRLAQIVRNLVSNAMKYGGPAGCRICVKAAADTPGVRTRLCVRVVDAGPGLTLAQRERLFAEFERVGDVAETGGVGLGLAISRRLAQAMGGDLSVVSEVGAGCTFKLALPVTPLAHAPATADAPQSCDVAA